MSQAHHSGNPDIKWDKGVVITSHYEDLWKANSVCGPEDIRHFQSRVEQFDALVQVEGQLQEVPKCKESFSKWLLGNAAAWAAGTPQPSPTEAREAADADSVQGLSSLLAKARLPQEVEGHLTQDMVNLGAVSVSELTETDWRSLPTWQTLRVFEQRRLLKASTQ